MMNGNKIFKGWPKTQVDAKKMKITVSPKYTDPRVIPMRNGLTWLGIVALAIFYLFKSDLLTEGTPANRIYFLIFGFVLISAGWAWLLYDWFKKTVHIEFTPQSIKIRSGWFGGNEYNRGYPHGFNMETHERAEYEYEEQQIEAAKRQMQRQAPKMSERIYRDSYHVFMDHVSGRVPIADVHGKKNATALVTRLQGVDQFMDIMIGEVTKGARTAGPDFEQPRPGGY